MYKVYCDDQLIYLPGDEELVIFNTKLELGDNKSGSFEFDLPNKNPYYDSLKKLTSVIRVDKDGSPIFYGRVLSIEKNFYGTRTVVCEGELAYLLDSIQEPRVYHSYTVRGFLDALITAHNSQCAPDESDTKRFTVGMVTVEDSNDSLYRYTNWETTLDDIQDKLLDRLGGHLRVRHAGGVRYLDYLEDYDNTNTQIIEFGENLLDYTEDADASEIATRIIPLGARLDESSIEGLEEYTTIKSVNNQIAHVESKDAVARYGVVTRTVSFDDVTEPANLLSKAKKYLEDIQFENISLTCSAIDLNMVDVDIERIKLGDSIRVVSAPHGMDRYFPVTALSIDLQNPENNTITLGTSIKSGISERTTSQNDALVQQIVSIPPQSDTLRLAIENATALITAATTGHVVTRPNEILIMDTADTATAKKLWRWNLNGLGYSSTGYNGAFGTAITMDGKIIGKYIAAKSIYADSFIAGELQTAWNGITDYIQLKNGELRVYNTSDQLVSKFNYNGEHFYRDDVYIGKIGTNHWVKDNSHKGLVFDLEYTGKYMAWGYQKTENTSIYTTSLCFNRDDSIYEEEGLHLGCDLYGEWFTLHEIALEDVSSGGYRSYSGSIPIIMDITDNGDGTIKWTYSNLQVRNGIIVGYWN